MNLPVTLFLFFLLALTPSSSQIQNIDLPLVSIQTQSQVKYNLNMLKLLLPTHNWIFCNKQMLYNVAYYSSQCLHQAAQEMKLNKKNVVQGNNNLVIGNGNVVIGSRNVVVGVDNWCFTSDYHTGAGRIDQGIVAIGNYKLVLAKINLILQDPKLAISAIDDSEFQALKEQNVAFSFFFQ